MMHLDKITTLGNALFVRVDKYINNGRKGVGYLFGSAENKLKYLQTVLSTLNSIRSKVDDSANIL